MEDMSAHAYTRSDEVLQKEKKERQSFVSTSMKTKKKKEIAIQHPADKSNSKQLIIVAKFNRKTKTWNVGSTFNEHFSVTQECQDIDDVFCGIRLPVTKLF